MAGDGPFEDSIDVLLSISPEILAEMANDSSELCNADCCLLFDVDATIDHVQIYAIGGPETYFLKGDGRADASTRSPAFQRSARDLVREIDDARRGGFHSIRSHRESRLETRHWWGLESRLRIAGAQDTRIAVFRDNRGPPFDEIDELVFLRCRSRIERRIAAGQDQPKRDRELMMCCHWLVSNLAYGVIFLNERNDIIYLNDVALEICKNGGDQILRQIRQRRPAVKASLPPVTDDQDARPLVRVVGDAMPLSSDDESGIMAVAIAIETEAGSSQGRGEAKVVLCTPGGAGDTASNASLLAERYSLTTAETRLVMSLTKGKRVKEAARDLSISENTVRMHLKRVFRKIGVTHQAELVRRVLAAPEMALRTPPSGQGARLLPDGKSDESDGDCSFKMRMKYWATDLDGGRSRIWE